MAKKKAIAYRCPICGAIVPDYNMSRYTKLINYKGRLILVCKDCGEFYEDQVLKAMTDRLAEDTAKATGLTPEAIKAMREEREYYQKEDERLVDEEVDVMDNEKVKRVFKKKGDQHEESKTPLRVMTEKFLEGLERERRKKIIVARADVLPVLNKNLKKRGVA